MRKVRNPATKAHFLRQMCGVAENLSGRSDPAPSSIFPASGNAAYPITAGDFLQGGQVALECAPTQIGDGKPSPAALADERLVHFHIARMLERVYLLGQRGVTHLDLVADEAELDMTGRREQGDDREADRMTKQLVELVAWMGHRGRISNAATINGITPTSSLTAR